jgi:hypothetical protein
VQVVVAADTLTGESDLPAHLPAGGPIDPTTIRELAAKVPWRRLVAHPDTGVLLHRDSKLLPVEDATPDGSDGSARREVAGRSGDPRLARLLTEPVTSAVLDYGTTRYRPPADLRDHVITRDATCIGPACHHPAADAQLDHTINYDELDPQPDRMPKAGSRQRRGREPLRGTTADYNLGPLCVRWHNAKTHGNWRLQQPEPGLFIWTSPLGRTYTRTARPLIPGWTTRSSRQPP